MSSLMNLKGKVKLRHTRKPKTKTWRSLQRKPDTNQKALFLGLLISSERRWLLSSANMLKIMFTSFCVSCHELSIKELQVST
ncbi:hypothetical protein HOLleu_32498 [Holothuria leucospilota]|uniref:Uncharacterized protein n=1 Tax=Holothuria leucospilota TaxID=206669 RepID=A0A9Q1BIT0_HOLLE|nr:hypothetical protein HOLleu_32498 [Holothuria leucospilota]